MKVTVEKINGQMMTVVWYRSISGVAIANDLWRRLVNSSQQVSGYVLHMSPPYDSPDHIATALPPLPRHPTPEDALLLYRYASEGIYPIINFARNGKTLSSFKWQVGQELDGFGNPETDHLLLFACEDSEGNRIDVAIK